MERLITHEKSLNGKLKVLKRFISLNIPFLDEFNEYLKLLQLFDIELDVS